MEKENKLQVEQYDASEVEAKKKNILKKVATGVGAAALLTVLSAYGLAQEKKDIDSTFVKQDLDTVPVIVKQDLNIEPITVKKDTIDIGTIVLPMETFILGGGGAWFNSVIEFLET
jgi:hypothetical protein